MTQIYVRVANAIVAEPAIELPDTTSISSVFAPALNWVNVTTQPQVPQPGWTAVETGGTWAFAAPAPSTAAPIVPTIVTAVQAKCALFLQPGAETGKTLLDDVNAWVATQGGIMAVAWNAASVITRSSAFITAAQANFGWTSAFLDELFTNAAAIVT